MKGERQMTQKESRGRCDVLIRNCRIVDGTAAPWYRGDVAVKDGYIIKTGKIDPESFSAAKTVDACDCYLAPGFIDIHSHSDTTLLKYRLAESRVLQGVTTEIGGNCGMSSAPVSPESDKKADLEAYMGEMPYNWNSLGEFLDRIEEAAPSVNFGTAVGHGTLRIAAMGFDNRKPAVDEMNVMKDLLRRSLCDGAFAMTTGLIYPPGCYAKTDELIELSKILPEYGALYMTHMREEGAHVVDSVREAIEICRQSGASLEISHHKVTYKPGWGKSCRTTLTMIEEARREGLDVTADQYPYRASSTTMDSNIPQWAFEGGMEALFDRLKDPETRAKLREESNAGHIGRWGDIYVGYVLSEKNMWTVGKSIEEIAKTRGVDPADACFDLVLEERGNVDEINFGMCEEDIEYIMKSPYVMTGSDGKSVSFDYPGRPHPRYFGTFPRVISHYCRDRGLFTLETAIHKMTGMPAAKLGIEDRGLIKEGMRADLVLFDFDKITDTPDFARPKQPCEGIKQVYVNGILTAENGRHTGAAAGMVLRKGR